MSLHESQSVLMGCRPAAAAVVAFVARWRARPSRQRPAWDEDNIHRLYTAEADFIRVDATRLTYPAHVIRAIVSSATSSAAHGIDDCRGLEAA